MSDKKSLLLAFATRTYVTTVITLGLAFSMAACSSDDEVGFNTLPAEVNTAPAISNINLSRDSADHMEGNGTITITAEIAYRDAERNLESIRVEISDGTSLTIAIPGPITQGAGTVAGNFEISTTIPGVFVIEFWLVDSGGLESNHIKERFSVVGDTNTWTERLTALPHALNDVIWAFSQYVAVGDGGTIMTSPDGIDWTIRDSGTDADLYAIGFDGYDYIAVGDKGTVLFSIGGEDWTTQFDGPDNISLRAVFHLWPLVVGGIDQDTNEAFMMMSPDHGDNWLVSNNLPQSGRSVTGIAGWLHQYVATTRVESLPNDARVLTSVDGLNWVELVIDTEAVSTLSIARYDDGFVAGGTGGRVYTSPDGVNWTMHQTPVTSDFLSAVEADSKLVAYGTGDVGVATTDHGATWETFSITAGYESRGLAWSGARFVSVGRTGPGPGEGAIFSTQ